MIWSVPHDSVEDVYEANLRKVFLIVAYVDVRKEYGLWGAIGEVPVVKNVVVGVLVHLQVEEDQQRCFCLEVWPAEGFDDAGLD